MISSKLSHQAALVVAAFCFFIAMGMPVASFAQTADYKNRVERLERDMLALQRQVYKGGKAGALPPGIPDSSAADTEVKLQALESKISALTGKVEELTFKIDQINQKFEKLQGDVDYRLSQSEGKSTDSSSETGGTLLPEETAGEPSVPEVPNTLGAPGKETLVKDLTKVKPGDNSADKVTPQKSADTEIPKSPEDQYEKAINYMRQNDYANAEKLLTHFLDKNPKHKLAENAKYWLGESYYVRGDFSKSAVTFLEDYQAYPKGSKAPDNLLKLGMSLAQLGKKPDACKTYAKLTKEFPKLSADQSKRVTEEKKKAGCK